MGDRIMFNTINCDYECVAPEGYWDYDNEENICQYCWFRYESESNGEYDYDLGLISLSGKDKQYDEQILTIYYALKGATK